MGEGHPQRGKPAGSGHGASPDADRQPTAAEPAAEPATLAADRGAGELGREPAGAAAATATAVPGGVASVEKLRRDLCFNVLRNAFYHSARLRFFEWQHRGLMFAIVLFGTGGVTSLFGDGSKLLAALTALLATLDLVLDLRGKAQLHDALKRRYYRLLAKLEENPEASERQLLRWQAKTLEITAEEPVSYRAADAVAHNEAIDSLGRNPGKKQVLTPSQYRWRHFSTFQGVTFPYAEEVEGA